MRLLNLLGESRNSAARELLILLKKLGAGLGVFEHTVEEVQRVLSACEYRFDDPRARGDIIPTLRAQGRGKSDLVLLQSQLIRKLGELGINKRPNPKYVHTYQIDELSLEVSLDDEVRHFNDRALQDDVQSIRSIYALRRDRRPQQLEDSIAILVTSNSAFAKAAYDFGRRREDKNEVST